MGHLLLVGGGGGAAWLSKQAVLHASVLASKKAQSRGRQIERLGEEEEEEAGRLLKWKIACVTSAWWNSYGLQWGVFGRFRWDDTMAGRRFGCGENGGKELNPCHNIQTQHNKNKINHEPW